MTENQTGNTTPDDATGTVDAVPFSAGTALREARMHQGLSVDEVSNRVKFAPRQIEALEADDFAHLPETAFLRGFVRSYARLLQIDPSPLLAALPQASAEPVPLTGKAPADMPYPDVNSERKSSIIWLAAALAVAVVLVLFAWLLGAKPKEQNAPEATVSGGKNATVETLVLPEAVPVSAVADPEPVTVTSGVAKTIAEKPIAEKPGAEIIKAVDSPPTVQVAATPARPAAVPIGKPVNVPVATNNLPEQTAIRMTFDADSWVEITDKNGKVLLSQLNHAGTEQAINGSPPFSLTIGYAKGVRLNYKGKPVDLAPYDIADVAHLTLGE